MASKEQFLKALAKPYDRILFAKDVLKPVFGSNFTLESELRTTREEPNKTEKLSIKSVGYYGTIQLDDGRKVTCYEVVLQPSVRIEQSKVTIQQYVRKLLTAGQAALVNFVAPGDKRLWRFTLVAKDSEITEDGIQEKLTHAKRYTYLVEANRPNRTLAERLEKLGSAKDQNLVALTEAFSVEALSDAFFDEYKEHYQNFTEYLTGKRMVKEKGKWKEKKTGEPSAFLKSVFNGNEKSARDFCKKLMGRLVFLYFVQRKRWLGATNQQYKDGDPDFIFNLFQASGGDDSFYPNWLSPLFFNTLNNNQRENEEYTLPNGIIVHIPFLNGGLFDKEKVDEKPLTFPAQLFHNTKNPDSPKDRGFLDFLNAFNFTVYEDSPDDHTVAVDPEMLGHIFENLLEENKEKGAFYTPKEIVHFMCRESLIEYLTTHLEKEYTVYKYVGDHQVQLFGNDGKTGQLKMMEELGDKALNRTDVERIVKEKDIADLTREQILRIDNLLESVKICDPAIGSGAFPMGLLQEIFSIKEIIAYELELEWNAAGVKENIIQRSIYGVDIERGAVDIARLRFWLSLLVDSEDPKPLPNLEYKIVVGNSLISMFEEEPLEIDWEIKEGSQSNMFGHDELLKRQELLKKITETQKAYFHADAQKKRELALHIRNQKIDLLINQLSLMIQTKGEENKPVENGNKVKERMERYLDTQNWKRMIRKMKDLREHPEKPFHHFDWKLDFPEILNDKISEECGFDILIGNPPYIKIQNIGDELSKLFKEKYSTSKGKYDIYVLFIELAKHLIKSEGFVAYIHPTRFIKAGYGKAIREFLTQSRFIYKLVNFEVSQVFKEVTTYTGIHFYKENSKVLKYLEAEHLSFLNQDFVEVDYKLLGDKWSLTDDVNELNILEKINSHPKLENIFEGIYQGVIPMGDDIHVLKGELRGKYFHGYSEALGKEIKIESGIVRPMLKGENIRRYKKPESNLFIFYPHYLDKKNKTKVIPEKKVKREYPSAYNYIKNFEDELIKKKVKYKTNSEYWYSLHRARDLNIFIQEKIITPQLQNEPHFTIDQNNFIPDAGGYSLIKKQTDDINYKYYLGILNSKLLYYFIRKTSTPYNNEYYYFKTKYLEPFGIPKKVSDNGINAISERVELITNNNRSLKTKPIEREIDLLVYKLYNLTWEEVKVVDEEFEMGREEYEGLEVETL